MSPSKRLKMFGAVASLSAAFAIAGCGESANPNSQTNQNGATSSGYGTSGDSTGTNADINGTHIAPKANEPNGTTPTNAGPSTNPARPSSDSGTGPSTGGGGGQ